MNLRSQSIVKPKSRGQLPEMDVQSELPQASEDEKWTVNQASPPVIEIQDSTAECEEEARPSLMQMEEKAFVSRLHSFMKNKGSPIERIPHLGFKQINLWRIYKAVEKRGGYDLVSAQRLWKKVYDELGGSPGSTSAATCTRRHYERLVLPFERHIKCEEDRPLPLSKPRKPYKRNMDVKVKKAEVKRKRTNLDEDMDSETSTQGSPEAACRSEAVTHPHSSLWSSTADIPYPDCSLPNRAPADLCASVYALLPVQTTSKWTAHIPPAAAEVISPLEKKKRMAQASLNFPQGAQGEDKERPSVIRCSQSPARASPGRNYSSSDGSPLPFSSSSSRSASPLSVSSEDGPARDGEEPAPSKELSRNGSGPVEIISNCSEESRSVSCARKIKDFAAPNKDIALVSSQSLTASPIRSQMIASAWHPVHKGLRAVDLSHPFQLTSTSSFTKVVPKSGHLLRPAPIRPSYKSHQNKLVHQEEPVTRAKKQNPVDPWLYHTERRDKSRPNVSPAQQSLSHSTSALPVLCLLSSFDRSGRDSRHLPPFHPMFLPNRMRLPQSPQMYRHIPVGPAPSAISGSAVYPYPYSFPLFNPQSGYTLPAVHPIYPHKL